MRWSVEDEMVHIIESIEIGEFEMSRRDEIWMAVSFVCVALFFLLIVPLVYQARYSLWWSLEVFLLWCGNIAVLRYANKQW